MVNEPFFDGEEVVHAATKTGSLTWCRDIDLVT